MASLPFGKYQIRRELGRGAMGVVYEAEDPEGGDEVALKVLSLAPNAGPEARRRRVERFYREAQALAHLRHPGVVRLFEQGEVSGRHFFTMELVRGTTLRDRIQMAGPLSVADLVRLAVEMCEALDHIHSRWVVHRDVKPENIMLLPGGSSKLMDFGVAITLTPDGSPPTGSGFEGSPCYMSPEQVTGQPVDGRSDLYSLGVTLYEAATGRRAVQGDTIPAIIHQVVNEFPPPPGGMPVYLQAVLMRALAKNPAHRYARASQMAEDLRAAARAGGTTPSPTRPLQTGQRAAPPPLFPAAPRSAATGAADRCRMHPAAPSVGFCQRCGSPMCYGCLVEVPGRGALCRTCAFGGRA